MKRWIPWGIVLILVLLLVAGLLSTALNPGAFTGEWYSASGERFHFREGVVTCDAYNILTGPDNAMCGAYCFDRNSIAVFSAGIPGLEVPRQLYLIHGEGCDRLCDAKDGTGSVYFYREIKAVPDP